MRPAKKVQVFRFELCPCDEGALAGLFSAWYAKLRATRPAFRFLLQVGIPGGISFRLAPLLPTPRN